MPKKKRSWLARQEMKISAVFADEGYKWIIWAVVTMLAVTLILILISTLS